MTTAYSVLYPVLLLFLSYEHAKLRKEILSASISSCSAWRGDLTWKNPKCSRCWQISKFGAGKFLAESNSFMMEKPVEGEQMCEEQNVRIMDNLQAQCLFSWLLKVNQILKRDWTGPEKDGTWFCYPIFTFLFSLEFLPGMASFLPFEVKKLTLPGEKIP